MDTSVKSYTTESILISLGYPDPLVAARQHARMILLAAGALSSCHSMVGS